MIAFITRDIVAARIHNITSPIHVLIRSEDLLGVMIDIINI